MGEVLKAKLLMSSGQYIPQVGIGTYRLFGSDVHKCVKAGLVAGYKLIDSSSFFKNEAMIRVGIGSFPRDQFFLTSKMTYGSHGVNDPKVVAARILDKMKVKYLDLLMLQSPVGIGALKGSPHMKSMLKGAWKVLENYHKEGKARNLGICNFSQGSIDYLLSFCTVQPTVLQTELHPLCYNTELVEYCKQKNIVVQASSPLAKGRLELLQNVTLVELSQKLNKTAAQIALRWGLQKGHCIIPRTSRVARIRENAQLDFELSPEDMAKIDSLNIGLRVGWATMDS